MGKSSTKDYIMPKTAASNFCKEKKRVDNTTGHTGVYRTKHGTYMASITLNKVRHYLGIYPSLEQAVEARQEGVETMSFSLEMKTSLCFQESEISLSGIAD